MTDGFYSCVCPRCSFEFEAQSVDYGTHCIGCGFEGGADEFSAQLIDSSDSLGDYLMYCPECSCAHTQEDFDSASDGVSHTKCSSCGEWSESSRWSDTKPDSFDDSRGV